MYQIAVPVSSEWLRKRALFNIEVGNLSECTACSTKSSKFSVQYFLPVKTFFYHKYNLPVNFKQYKQHQQSEKYKAHDINKRHTANVYIHTTRQE